MEEEHQPSVTANPSQPPPAAATAPTGQQPTSPTTSKPMTTTLPQFSIHQDDIERQLGITEYLSLLSSPSGSSSSTTTNGFMGVVKARYSDFVVHEVNDDGVMAQLTDTTIPPTMMPPPTPKLSWTIKEENVNGSSSTIKSETSTDNTTVDEKAKTLEKDTDGPCGESSKQESSPETTTTTTTSPNESKLAELAKLIQDERIASSVFQMLQSHDNADKGDHQVKTSDSAANDAAATIAAASPPPKFVTLPALEKSQRKLVHEWVRSSLSTQARADTLDGKIRIWHIQFETEMPNYQTFGNSHDNRNGGGGHRRGGGGGKRNKRNNNHQQSHKRMKRDWPSDRPDFLQFVLYKENTDTTTATREVNRRGSTGRIGYAGMKDKRGITTQFCTLYRTTPDQIIQTSSKLTESSSSNKKQQVDQSHAGGDDHAAKRTSGKTNNESKKPVPLSDNNKATDNTTGGGGGGAAAGGGGGNSKEKGVSVVRVGNFSYVDKELRLGMLKGNRFDIVIRNVRTLQEEHADNSISSNTTQSEKEEEELQTQRRAVLESSAESVKARGFINYFGTQRFGKFHDTHLVGIAVLQGDYRKAIEILMEPKADDRPDVAKARQDWQSRFQDGEKPENERESAKRVMKRMNRFMTGELAVLQALVKRPMDYKRAFTCIPRNLRAMYIHAVQSLIWNRAASYRMKEMENTKVLVGDLVPGPESKFKVHVVTEEDVTSNKYTIEDIVLPCIGSKTTYPTNEVTSVIKSIMKEIEISSDMFKKAQDRELILNGDYRKVICHPTDFDYEIKEYYDPLQPLLQTDLMKLHGQEISIVDPTQPSSSDKNEDASREEAATKTAPHYKTRTAMVVGLTLPSSSYATIALRELMKLPTSNEFQKGQAL